MSIDSAKSSQICAGFGLAIVLLCMTASLSAQPQVKFSVYPIPGYSGGVTAITKGPDGALWFTTWDSVWRSTTAGVMTEYLLPDDGIFYPQGRGVTTITAGPDGALWFTEGAAYKIGRITTAGVISEYSLAAGQRSPQRITTGPDGALWFTEFIDRIGRITTNGTVSEFQLSPCQGTCGRYPSGITAGPDGALWFTDLGDDRIHRITTTGQITDYGQVAVANSGYAPGNITPGPDGALWFTGGGGTDVLGRITTTGVMTLFPLPIYPRPTYNNYNNLEPNSITRGPDGALWFTAARVNVLGRMTTQGSVSLYTLPPVAVADDNFRAASVALGPDGALWIGSQGSLVRVSLDTTPPLITAEVAPRVLWPPNGKIVPVTVTGRITDVGSGLVAGSLEYMVADEYGLVQPRGHITLDSAGNYFLAIPLCASRDGNDMNGREYVIWVKARDNAGNRGMKPTALRVPHDRH
jgi:virginiamycin B lyase